MTALTEAQVQAALADFVPEVWIIPGDGNANCYGFIDAKISCEGEFTRPLYKAPLHLIASLRDANAVALGELWQRRLAEERLDVAESALATLRTEERQWAADIARKAWMDGVPIADIGAVILANAPSEICDHSWIDATNRLIENSKYCSKCGLLAHMSAEDRAILAADREGAGT